MEIPSPPYSDSSVGGAPLDTAVRSPAQEPQGHLLIRQLSKHYHDHQAVRDISLEIQPGEFVALLGPSGCGKTTLLRCIAGLVTPTNGDILLDGESIVPRPVYRRELGMVFQSYALFPHMSVIDNVAFPLKMKGERRAQALERAHDALRMVRMEQYATRIPTQLSGGQQQRVALARAVSSKPRLLLLDEPFSALDAKLRETMQVELRHLQRELKITTLFVTHDQSEALVTADRIAVLNSGVVEQFDSPQVSYHKPASLFVADFIGKMNRLPGTAVGGRPGTVGVLRPERIRLFQAAGAGGVLSGTVREAIFVGEKLNIYVDTVHGMLIVAEQNRNSETLRHLAIGSRVSLDWDPDDLLLLPVQ